MAFIFSNRMAFIYAVKAPMHHCPNSNIANISDPIRSNPWMNPIHVQLWCSRCCLGFRKDPYWARCCIFSIQLSSPSLSLIMASTCTSMPMICRSTSALRPARDAESRLASHCVSRRHRGLAEGQQTPAEPHQARLRLSGWVLPSSWPKSTSHKCQWRRHVSTSQRRRVAPITRPHGSVRVL